MVLLVDACARPESRTLPLAQKAAGVLADTYTTLNLYGETVEPLDYATLLRRDSCISKGVYGDRMFRYAKQFREAEEIIIAAPYWDLSFPAVLKCYIEAICVSGLTFRYTEAGIPEGLCRAKRLIYVTTAGGFIPERNFGYDYIRQLCMDYFGIPNTVYIKAEGLDILGADVPGILAAAEAEVEALKKA